MNKPLKYALIGLLIVLVVIQFIGPERPEVQEDNPQDLFVISQIDPATSALIKSACYDCHSMETKYPWYAGVAPVKWSIYHHIEEGREELNFSKWGSMETERKIKKLKEMVEEIEEGEMPLRGYVKMHPKADLNETQKVILIDWARDFASRLPD